VDNPYSVRIVAEVVIDHNLLDADSEDFLGHDDAGFPASHEAADSNRDRSVIRQRIDRGSHKVEKREKHAAENCLSIHGEKCNRDLLQELTLSSTAQPCALGCGAARPSQHRIQMPT
jgi:hypothetical protein